MNNREDPNIKVPEIDTEEARIARKAIVDNFNYIGASIENKRKAWQHILLDVYRRQDLKTYLSEYKEDPELTLHYSLIKQHAPRFAEALVASDKTAYDLITVGNYTLRKYIELSGYKNPEKGFISFSDDKQLNLIAEEVHKEEQVPKKYKRADIPEEDEKYKYKSYFELEEHLILEVLTSQDEYAFAYCEPNGEVKLIPEFNDIRPVELPIKADGEIARVVQLPDEGIREVSLLLPAELLAKIEAHIKQYCDLDKLDLKLCSFYPLFTWFYPKLNTVGYLRFLADTGKGKSRMARVVSDLCIYPLSAAGAGSFSGMMRMHELWRGTIRIDEIDTLSGKEDKEIKYHNLGFEAGQYFILSDKKDPRRQQVFDPFGPRVFCMREPFRDMATEGRLLSISPHETTSEDIPILLDKEYTKQTMQLRNEIARFALQHWHEVDSEKLMNFRNLGIEPRLQQLAMPLSVIFQLWQEGEETFKEYVLKRQQELKRERSMSWHGMMFNYVLELALGDEYAGEDYAGYYIPKNLIDSEKAKEFYDKDALIIQAITPAMVAKAFNTNPKTAAKTLRSIGFEVKSKKITYFVGDKPKSKHVRCFYVQDEKRWNEIVQRYCFDAKFTQVTQVTQPSHLTEIGNTNILLVLKEYSSIYSSVTSVTCVNHDVCDHCGINKKTTQYKGEWLCEDCISKIAEEADSNMSSEAFDEKFHAQQDKEAAKRMEEMQ